MTPTRRPRPRRSLSSGRASGPVGEDRLQRGSIHRSNIEKLRSMDPGPRSRSPGTTAHQHVVAVPACARTGSSGDPYAAAISRNCGVWIPGLAHARPGRQHINTSSPSPSARGQAPAGIHTPQQYRETAECGTRASLTLARDDSGTIVLSSAKWPHINTSSPRRRGPMLRRQYRETAEYGSRASLTLARDDSGTIVLPQRNDRTPTRRPREGGDPYAAAISRNCGVWIPGLAHARPGRQSGTMVLPQRNGRTPTRRPREDGDPYAAAISRNCGVWIPGLARARPGRQRHQSVRRRNGRTPTRRPREGGDPYSAAISRNCGV